MLLCCCLGATPALAARTEARLLLANDAARPGDTVWAGIRLRPPDGWHTYWKNPGQSGFATTIKWDLPAGVTSGDTLWPLPAKLKDHEITMYIYGGESVLLVPLKLASDLKPGPVTLHAQVSWLECSSGDSSECVPGKSQLQATLTVGTLTSPSADAPLLESWRGKIPRSAAGLSTRAFWDGPARDNPRSLVIEWKSPAAADDVDFLPADDPNFEIQPEVRRIGADGGMIRIRKAVKKLSGDWPKEVSGVLTQTSGGVPAGYEVSLTPAETDAAGPASSAPATETRSLGLMLLYALLGGLILNVMPCVLPVIALKILGFVGEARNEPRRLLNLGLLYALGVLASFLVLALIVIGVKAAGHQAGWGMQFGNPWFVVSLTVLVTLVALNLFGLFEVTLSGRVMGAAGSLASKHGAAGAFFNGVLATALATPCTAPFLGAALGFAFAQSPLVIVLIFLTAGVGLALPYVLLSAQPAWLKLLPKPGLWMVRFKVAMGFPMLATAVWLFSVAAAHFGDRAWWLGIFLVFVALAAWVYGEFVQRGTRNRAPAGAVAAGLLVVGYSWAVAAGLNGGRAGLDWQPWSPQAVAQVRDQGRPVLVDFTAKWCLTCNTLVKPVLESRSVREKIKEINAAALLADYTDFPPAITEELARYQRAGVPLVLVYPKNRAEPPIVLPDGVTPGMVLSALNRAMN
jgi:thiol:disulfide interchange protein DsbD